MRAEPIEYLFSRPFVVNGLTQTETVRLLKMLTKKAGKMPVPRHWERADLVSVGLMTAVECMPKWREDGGSSRLTYAYVAAVREMYIHAKENRGPVRVPQHSSEKTEASDEGYTEPATTESQAESAAIANQAMSLLGPKGVEIATSLALGYTMEELAEREGISKQAIYSRWLTAKKRVA